MQLAPVEADPHLGEIFVELSRDFFDSSHVQSSFGG